ncbi:hypothetical protein AK830_g4742 [Neonectria ditissima]|uniref:F-box domain-containing protein n=1 Tax=Neonectria ditissima TaxID=78410 RepID=A0A0P7BFM5_9HYPO|nr:hypothetical protein AK830_g4742 [Neonectria ditissima]
MGLPRALLLLLHLADRAVSSDGDDRWTPHSPCPTEIKAIVPIGAPFGTHDEVHAAMKTCPNITELDLHAAPFGCVEFPNRYNLPFNLEGSDRYLSSPQVLKLDGYDFDEREWKTLDRELDSLKRLRPRFFSLDSRWSSDEYTWVSWFGNVLRFVDYGLTWVYSGNAFKWYRASQLPPKMQNKTNLDLWLEAMDFSHIHTLAIKSGGLNNDSVVHRLPARLSSLRSLTIQGPWIDNASPLPKIPPAGDFILAFPPSSLTNLTWLDSGSCGEEVFDIVLQHHGETLQQLEWRNAEVMHYPRPAISIDQIQQLGTLAPRLQDLTIDLNREEDSWPLTKLDALGSNLPNLTNLTIYFELVSECGRKQRDDHGGGRCTESEYLAQPLLNPHSATEIFKRLRAAKVGEELTAVHFRSGDWTQSWGDEPPIWDHYRMDDMVVRVDCSVINEEGTRKGVEKWCRGDEVPQDKWEATHGDSYHETIDYEVEDYDSVV